MDMPLRLDNASRCPHLHNHISSIKRVMSMISGTGQSGLAEAKWPLKSWSVSAMIVWKREGAIGLRREGAAPAHPNAQAGARGGRGAGNTARRLSTGTRDVGWACPHPGPEGRGRGWLRQRAQRPLSRLRERVGARACGPARLTRSRSPTSRSRAVRISKSSQSMSSAAPGTGRSSAPCIPPGARGRRRAARRRRLWRRAAIR